MIKTKMTVRVEHDLLQNVKHYARKHNTTLTELLNTWLRNIPAQSFYDDSPIVKRLAGTMSSDVTIDEYKKHLEEKYAK